MSVLVHLDTLSPSPQPTDPPFVPFVTNVNIQRLRSYAWSLKYNSRALENHYLPVYRETLRTLLEPLQAQPGQQRIIAEQQYLWCGRDHPDKKTPPRHKKSARSIAPDSESEESEGEEDEDADEIEAQVRQEKSDKEDEDEDEEAEQVEVEEEEQGGSDSDGISITASDGSVNAIHDAKFAEGKPDVTTLRVDYAEMPTPPTLYLAGAGPEEKQQRRELGSYIDNGGMTLLACIPDSLTELKRPPRRFRAKRRYDNPDAEAHFLLNLSKQLVKAANQMARYTVIFFQKYEEAEDFLAIIGSGPFWVYAIVCKEDCPWTLEEGPKLSRREENTRLRKFSTIFGTNIYFEIGTDHSDAEWNEIRRVFFLGEPGQIGYRPTDVEVVQPAAAATVRTTRASAQG